MSTLTIAVCPLPPVTVIVQACAGGGDDVGAATAFTLIVDGDPVAVIGAVPGESVADAPSPLQTGAPIVIDPPGPTCATVKVCGGPPTPLNERSFVDTFSAPYGIGEGVGDGEGDPNVVGVGTGEGDGEALLPVVLERIAPIAAPKTATGT